MKWLYSIPFVFLHIACVLADPIVLTVKPSMTNAAIVSADSPHYVTYEKDKKGSALLLWLPGTNGMPDRGPFKIYEAAVENGYRVIGLSYIDAPAVAQICNKKELLQDSGCAAKFREKRTFGRNVSDLIEDRPEDAIVSRFTMLLRYLVKSDPSGNWQQFINDGMPRWDRIAVAGQSQGGGMAAFIAKHESVARVVMFSGGWDYAAPGRIADWYSEKSVTPSDRWYGTYHVSENNAATIAQTYDALGIPKAHQYALDQPVSPGKEAHGQGISNPAYREIWDRLLSRN